MGRPNLRNKLRASLLPLLQEGAHDGKALAEHLGVPRRTLDRLIADLRGQGHRIVAVREGARWEYRVEYPGAQGVSS